jgi:hypothetical protein
MQVQTVPKSSSNDGSRLDKATFSSLEWLVIAIGSRADTVPLSASAIGRSLLQLYDTASEEMAGPCLETLRRTSALVRRFGWSLPAIETGIFLHVGWTEAHLEQMIESVSQTTLSGESKSWKQRDEVASAEICSTAVAGSGREAASIHLAHLSNVAGLKQELRSVISGMRHGI